MHAVVISNGAIDVEPRAEPTPSDDELLVEVHAAGLNGADLLQVAGHYPPPPGVDATIPGLEVAGIVRAVGARVTRFAEGDRVMGLVAGAGQAELAVLHERIAMAIPDGLDLIEAGGLPEVMTTAHDALFTRCALQPGERLLVTGAAGGVGVAAVQLGLAAGATVVASVRSAASRPRIEALGARAIAPDATAAEEPFDVVLELVGGPGLPASLEALSVNGRIAVIGVGAGATAEIDLRKLMARRGAIHGSTLRTRPLEQKADAARRVERSVLPLVERGSVRVLLAATFSLQSAQAAYAAMATPGKLGKVVLVMPVAAGRRGT
jgi:NADPH2:quinone reductase